MLRRINLVPKVPASTKLQRLLPLLLAVGLLLTAAVLYGENWRLSNQAAVLAAEINQLEIGARQAEALQATVQQYSGQVEAARKRSTELDQQVRRVAEPVAEKPAFSAVLAEISQAMPPSIRCNRITVRQDGGTIEGLAIQYRELPQLVNELRRNPRFSSLTLMGIERGGERLDGPFSFTIIFKLQP